MFTLAMQQVLVVHSRLVELVDVHAGNWYLDVLRLQRMSLFSELNDFTASRGYHVACK